MGSLEKNVTIFLRLKKFLVTSLLGFFRIKTNFERKMENFIILTSIGKAIDKGSFSNEEFTYSGVKYEKLLLWDQFDKLISEFL